MRLGLVAIEKALYTSSGFHGRSSGEHAFWREITPPFFVVFSVCTYKRKILSFIFGFLNFGLQIKQNAG
jgi:hypothetical protein